MKQLVQSVRSGELSLIEVDVPTIGPTEVLVATSRSTVSAGTERAVRGLAKKNLLQKARARPDLVRQVIKKARTEGFRATATAVQNKLEDLMPLGYSGVGIAVEVGEHVEGVRIGDRVATGGAGHGEYQVVAGMLAVRVPAEVSDANASLATVASIALHGLRLANLGPGSRLCVVGLGLLGQIACRLAQASGYLVAGVDLKPFNVDKARASGVEAVVDTGEEATRALLHWSRDRGVDAVLITAATQSSDPVRRSTDIARDRAPIVVVGDVGLELERRPFYDKELSLLFARSYGPGRYDRSYEEWAVDYPIGHVRWTEGRNLEAVLDLLATGRVTFEDLVTHEFAFDEAERAYALLEAASEPYLGIQLRYPQPADRPALQPKRALGPADAPSQRSRGGRPRIGIIGAGNFVRATLLPALQKANIGDIKVIASASGVTAKALAGRAGIPRSCSSAQAVIDDPEIDLVVIATPHDTHAELTIAALEAGKDVFCEKPLALTEDELDRVEAAWRASGRSLQVGFNRRHSPAITAVQHVIGTGGGPLTIMYRVNAGRLPKDHWYFDRKQGGRVLGEMCHMVDTCNALVGDIPVVHSQLHIAGGGSALLADSVLAVLTYEDGSVASIAYSADGHPSMSKERIEVLGRGHSAIVDDFNRVEVDGKETRHQGKGHVEQLANCRGDGGAVQSSRTALRFLSGGG